MNLRHKIDQFGFAFHRNAFTTDQLVALLRLLSPTTNQIGVRSRRGSAYAARNLLWDRPEVSVALARLGLDRRATEALGRNAFPINVTYFDKTPGANWNVPGHQDRMMPVEREVAEPGFSGWSTKLGVVYVEPPLDVLSNLLALRIHLDACPARNGALAVVPGSHLRGRLVDADVAAISSEQFTICDASAGDILFMKPLLVHRSSPAEYPSHRRVLHVVYAVEEPGKQIRWKQPA
ncbi:MAG: phytanoyl-CoA dioxygenase family protein [Planctomycetales bacterium]